MTAACLGITPTHAAPAAPAAQIKAIDATGAFIKFWAASRDKPEAEQVQMFLDSVVTPHANLFTSDVLHGSALSGEAITPEHKREVVTKYLRQVGPYAPRMLALAASINRDLNAYAQGFARTFPDYAAATPVIFTVSLFSFDGGTRNVDGRTALLFGIDGIARFHAPDESLAVLFDHELFHQYHAQVAPSFAPDDVPLWMSLWEEGLATYVSQQMNPGTTDAQALMSATLDDAVKPKLQALAREFLANFESHDEKAYAAFFFGANGRADIPPRAGYALGLRVVRAVANGRDLTTIAHLQADELREAVRTALRRLADG